MGKIKIIIHGGFFAESQTNDATKVKKQEALKEIITKGYHYLRTHTAIQTVAYTVHLLEDHPLFNAGIGSQIQSDGVIRMSAALMDGDNLNMAGVINIVKVKNPILIAEKLLSYEDRILGGKEATLFARTIGFEYFDTETSERRIQYESKTRSSKTSTVGCVCLDENGRLAVATSTGGKGFEVPGRISDSATVAGNYANKYCGVSLTGVGEDIVNNAMAAKIVTRVTDGMPICKAFSKTFDELKEINGYAGAIGIDHIGNMYHQESVSKMVYASYDGTTLECFT